MFLFAIEKQMRNTTREIQAGCPSHTKAIYARRNELLAVQLSDLLNGRQDITAFLDNCSHAITSKNNSGVQAFINQRNSQLMSPAQQEWIVRNRATALPTALSVHWTIAPSSQTRLDTVLARVEQLAFRRDPCDLNTNAIQEDSVLSRVGPRDARATSRFWTATESQMKPRAKPKALKRAVPEHHGRSRQRSSKARRISWLSEAN